MFFLFVAMSCDGTKKVVEENGNTDANPTEQVNTTSPHQIIFEDVAEGDSLFASIEKTYCFGHCPVYTMKIYNKGYVLYEGKANVNLIGKASTVIGTDEMIPFIDMANEIGYFEMKDNYDNEYITDLPSTTTSIVINRKRKTVRRRVDYPNSIKAFEKLFEDMIEAKGWNASRD